MTTCPKCRLERPQETFIKGWRWCDLCRAAYRRGRRDHARELERAARYGISPEQQRELYAEQLGQCAACSDPITYASANLDHCHGTGVVRGFLCGDCNHALGFAHDDATRLLALATYLQLHAAIEPTRRDSSRCRNGHLWAPATTYVHPSGKRHCIPCRRDNDRRRSSRRVAQ